MLGHHDVHSGGWGLIWTHSCPQCLHSKKNSNSTLLVLGFESRKDLCKQLVRLQSSSLSPSLSQCLSSGNHSLRLFQRQSKVWLQNQMPSSWSCSLAWVGLASTNTVCFRVCSSRCWLQACLWKMWYHSCYSDLRVHKVFIWGVLILFSGCQYGTPDGQYDVPDHMEDSMLQALVTPKFKKKSKQNSLTCQPDS